MMADARSATMPQNAPSGLWPSAIYSLIKTAKMQGLDPRKYLSAVLERIADHPINKIDALLPWNIDLQD
ncbi:MAG: transposase domain-containing protein [Rhodospirillales bacterium]|jgi:hypothetical protein|nr:transposase domain-containing protein [Rhodospirillales bacterium]|tara:strand:+ start:3698 stop:3904 length:207 start_codon:yes stop_codon:yes gene_type:complete